jgi:hypothetical protein
MAKKATQTVLLARAGEIKPVLQMTDLALLLVKMCE